MTHRIIPIVDLLDSRMRPTHSSLETANLTPEAVCENCTSGMCCVTEDPIELEAADVERLAAHLNLSPEQFVLTYTSDAFRMDSNADLRQRTLDNKNKKVAMLARKTTYAGAECVFLGWRVNDSRHLSRGCTVHAARPAECRSYTYKECADLEKPTWELACAASAVIQSVEGELTGGGYTVESAPHFKQESSEKHYTGLDAPEFSVAAVEYLQGLAHEARAFMKTGDQPKAVPAVLSRTQVADYNKRVMANPKGMLLETEYALRPNAVLKFKPKDKPGAAMYPYAFFHRAALGVQFKGPIPLPAPWYEDDVEPGLRTEQARALVDGARFYVSLANCFMQAWKIQESMGVTEQQLLFADELALTFTSGLRSETLFRRLGLYGAWKLGKERVIGHLRRVTAEYEDVRKDMMQNMPSLEFWLQPVLGIPEVRPRSQWFEQWSKMTVKLKSLGSSKAFDKAYDACLYARILATANPGHTLEDTTALYAHYLDLLSRTKLTEDNYVDYYNLLTHIAYGMHNYGMTNPNVYPWALRDLVKDLAWSLMDWMTANKRGHDDPELIGEFVDATHLLLGFPMSPRLARVIDTLVLHQDHTGGWLVNNTTYGMRWSQTERDVPPDQQDYLYSMEHSTMVAVDALRAFLDSQIGTINERRNTIPLAY